MPPPRPGADPSRAMTGSNRHRIGEPTLILLAVGAATVMVICIIAIIETGDPWFAVLTVVAIGLIGLAIIVDLRGVISDTGDAADVPPPAPGRAVVVCTAPLTADQVLGALASAGADHGSVMFVAPEGLGGHGLMVDERDYARARRAETSTVAALRRAGINAAGH